MTPIYRLLPKRLRLSLAKARLGFEDVLTAVRVPQRANSERYGSAQRARPSGKPHLPLTAEERDARLRASRERKAAKLSAMTMDWPTTPSGTLHAVRYAKSGKTLRVRDDRSLLQAGTDAGLDLTFSCTLGGCGACRAQLTSGEVELAEPNCLSAEERDAGYVLLCVARPLGDVALEA